MSTPVSGNPSSPSISSQEASAAQQQPQQHVVTDVAKSALEAERTFWTKKGEKEGLSKDVAVARFDQFS